MSDYKQPSLFAYADYDSERRAAMAAAFQSAAPFPHIVIDDFLRVPAEEVTPAFPDPAWDGWTIFTDGYQFNKRFCGDIAALPPLFQAMIYELSAPAFLTFLEEVSGVRGLIADPYLQGGGLHCSGEGGVLAPHADFHHYAKLDLFRRINVLVYFNTDWRDADGGLLELYEKGKKTPEKAVLPVYARMVIFLTDDKSVHGFSQPIVGPDRWRKSLALYYYTSEETRQFSGDSDTLWQQHGRHSLAGSLRLITYKVLLKTSRLFSKLAHRANPNLVRKPRQVKTP